MIAQKKKRCCSYERNGDKIKKLSCQFVGHSECKEIFYNECNVLKTSQYCSRKQCCKFSKKGKHIKKS